MDRATRTTAIVFAHTIVDAPKNGAISRAAAISEPSDAVPVTNTSSSSGGRRRAPRPPARRPDAVAAPVGDSVVVGREVGLASAADRAEPVGGDVVEGRSGRDAAVRVPVGGVVDESTGLADPLLRGGRRHGPRG